MYCAKFISVINFKCYMNIKDDLKTEGSVQWVLESYDVFTFIDSFYIENKVMQFFIIIIIIIVVRIFSLF